MKWVFACQSLGEESTENTVQVEYIYVQKRWRMLSVFIQLCTIIVLIISARKCGFYVLQASLLTHASTHRSLHSSHTGLVPPQPLPLPHPLALSAHLQFFQTRIEIRIILHWTNGRISLWGLAVCSQGTKALAVPLVTNTSILRLNLRDNWMEAMGGAAIAKMLKENYYITGGFTRHSSMHTISAAFILSPCRNLHLSKHTNGMLQHTMMMII